LQQRTISPVFVVGSVASLDVSLGSPTPFILERAKPSKDGDAKLWAFDLPAKARSVVARLPKGWAGEEPVRPRTTM
jgi:hypothetical protein